MILSEKSATPAFAGASFFGIMLEARRPWSIDEQSERNMRAKSA
jgi:hypothetical protein